MLVHVCMFVCVCMVSPSPSVQIDRQRCILDGKMLWKAHVDCKAGKNPLEIKLGTLDDRVREDIIEYVLKCGEVGKVQPAVM